MKYEYNFGEIYSMAGGSINHSRIGRNVMVEIDRQINAGDKDCEVFNSDLSVEVKPNGRYVYPDVAVVCGDIDESELVSGAVKNPILIIEVLSEGTANYDQNIKYRFYTRMVSVKEYLIVDQYSYSAVLYRRLGDGDLFSRLDFDHADDIIELESIDVAISLTDIYRNVSLDA